MIARVRDLRLSILGLANRRVYINARRAATRRARGRGHFARQGVLRPWIASGLVLVRYPTGTVPRFSGADLAQVFVRLHKQSENGTYRTVGRDVIWSVLPYQQWLSGQYRPFWVRVGVECWL
jgi:hypothetical protein